MTDFSKYCCERLEQLCKQEDLTVNYKGEIRQAIYGTYELEEKNTITELDFECCPYCKSDFKVCSECGRELENI